MKAIKLTAAQAAMVGTYVTEAVHECTSMQLTGRTLEVLDLEQAITDLYDAGNSADEDKAGSGAVLVRVARAVRS